MLFIVYANFEKDFDMDATKRVINCLIDKKISYILSSNSKTKFGSEDVYPLENCVEKADVLVVLGGDGTVLNAVKGVGQLSIPILSINTGTVGFLTEIDPQEIEKSISEVIGGGFFIEERTLLEATYKNDKYYALNDVVLSKGSNTRPIQIKVEYDNKLLDKYLADGLIVSTPTGSTAYSLSCGGPILGPDIKAFIVNTICAHSLHSRPIVMADSHEISVSAPQLYMDADLIIDGNFVAKVSKMAEVRVHKAGYNAQFIRLKNDGFYDKLLKKLNYWGVTIN